MLSLDSLKKSFWALPINEAMEVLETAQEGLSEERAKERQQAFGKNAIPEKRKITKLKLLTSQFRSPLIILLVIAGIITVIVRDYKDAVFIFAAAAFNGLLGFYQENKAENALSHLKSYIKERAKVIRGGMEYETDSTELVPGDIIHISQGDRVPADARIITANNLLIDESILTGESLPIAKSTHPASFEAVLGDRKCMAFSGTLVVQGFALAAITATSLSTEIGKIAAIVRNNRQEDVTPLQKAISSFSITTSAILAALTALVFALGISLGHPPLAMFLTSVAMIVSAIPEGLPIAMTVILAISVQRLAARRGIIRKLLAAETLGNTTIILTDKTGTLTESKMFLYKIGVFDTSFPHASSEFLLRLGILNADFVIENPHDPFEKWRIIGRPLETAIIRAAASLGLNPLKIRKETELIEYAPFNSLAKYSAAVIRYGGKKYLAVLGAPEYLLKLGSKERAEQNKEHLKKVSNLAHAGSRVVGIAVKEIGNDFELSRNQKIEHVTFLGVLAFKDPVRSGVRETVAIIRQAGIRTVIVTGDHRGTAEAVAREIGLPASPHNTIDGAELDLMSDETLKMRLPALTVVSRVSPEGKVKIAKAFRDAGEIVAMTGDGINDAPSLKAADIGIAMGAGTDVAKDVAELVLLDNNFHTIVAAIEEGRRAMENIRKVIVYLFSTAANELILIGGALFLSLDLPLTAIQILWINLVTDSFPAIALAFENDGGHLSRKPQPITRLMDAQMRFLIFAIGIPTSAVLLAMYAMLSRQGYDASTVKTFIFAVVSTHSLFSIFAVRSLRRSIFSFNPFSNRQIAVGCTVGLILIGASLYYPIMQKILGTVPLPLSWVTAIILVTIANILAVETGKWFINRRISSD